MVAASDVRTWKLIVFRKGQRIERVIPAKHFEQAKLKLRELHSVGVKAHLSSCLVIDKFKYPPADTIKFFRAEGMLWCPYCRMWRYFKVPRAYTNAEFGTWQWYYNSFRSQEIRVCAWCGISVFDYYVGVANGTFAEVRSARRRKRRRRRAPLSAR